MEFREWLRRQIEERRVSVRMLAQRSGLSDAAISEWLAGKRHPRPESLQKLARGLRLPYDMVLQAAGYLPSETAGGGEAPMSPMERELLETVRLLPEELRDALLLGWLTTARGVLRQSPHAGLSESEQPEPTAPAPPA